MNKILDAIENLLRPKSKITVEPRIPVSHIPDAQPKLAPRSPAPVTKVAPVAAPPASYYPHWCALSGEITSSIMDKLDPGTILGVHHVDNPRRYLTHPKGFKIAWYAECNVSETNDAATGVPVKSRIAQSKGWQNRLIEEFGAQRFANLCELDAAREKQRGELNGPGNKVFNWEEDASAVKLAGYKYLAKSPTPKQVAQLRTIFGSGFVPRIVYEDVTAVPADDYRVQARELAAAGNLITLIIHSGNYGGFQGTSLSRAKEIVLSDFNMPNVEAYYGLPNGFQRLKRFS